MGRAERTPNHPNRLFATFSKPKLICRCWRCKYWRWQYAMHRHARNSWPPHAGAALRRNREVLDALANL